MKFVLKWLYPYWRAHAARMIVILVTGLIAAVLQTITPYLIKRIVNGLESHLTHEYIVQNVWLILLTGFAIYITNLLAQRNRAFMNFRNEWEIREKVFRHIVTLDSSFYHTFTTGDLVTRLADDISRKISWFSCSGVFRFVQAALTLTALLSVMFCMNWRLTLWALLPVPLIISCAIIGGRILGERFNRLQKAISSMYDFLETCFTGIKVIKANSKEQSQKILFDEKASAQMEAEISAGSMDTLFHRFFHSAGYLSVAIIYLAGGLMVINGKADLGDLVAFQFYAVMIVPSLMDISMFIVAGRRAGVSIRRVDALLQCDTALINAGNAPENNPETAKKLENDEIFPIKELSFENVSLKTPDGQGFLLKNVSFTAKKGQRIAIVGKIGCGKSLLMSLIMRLGEFSGGSIKANGKDIRALPLKEYRSRIGYSAQEAQIFTGTLRYNIEMERGSFTAEQINAAVNASQLAQDLSKFPQGLETSVGTRGFSVSGGQKQRLSIARALLCRPDILVLDDSTSAMDAQTENNFWQAYRAMLPDSICITATHRISTIESSDLIVVMDAGTVAAQGTHAELMRNSPLYREIYEHNRIKEQVSKE
ncbi:MAG: ABC transporter ATP-binding protein [Elusimicrobiales bacterium]|nr:ABC transporter ATP-binding protein [Elusimicrobiales bacterium]